jgi:hypothetical protein
MKKLVKIIMLGLFAALFYGDVQAQKTKVKKSKSYKKTTAKTVKFTPKEFGTFTSVSDLRDEADSTREYASVKNLIENNGVSLAYADSTFKPKEPLRRGDFVVSLNSALDAIRKAADTHGLDSTTSLVNVNTNTASTTTTSATNTNSSTDAGNSQGDIASVSDIKDVTENSIYYPATQSLIEKWKVTSPFSKTKSLNPGAVVTESEVYDVLQNTLGYTSPGANPYSKAMTRGKFAVILNNAINQKLSEVNAMSTTKTESFDSIRRQQELTLKQQEKQQADSLAKETELAKIEAQKKEAEVWTNLSAKEKRKQIRTNLKNQK